MTSEILIAWGFIAAGLVMAVVPASSASRRYEALWGLFVVEIGLSLLARAGYFSQAARTATTSFFLVSSIWTLWLIRRARRREQASEALQSPLEERV